MYMVSIKQLSILFSMILGTSSMLTAAVAGFFAESAS
jgi:hypothetical protein